MESWQYTTVNSMKVLNNANDIERFIIGQCSIWNIDQWTLGDKFIQGLRQSIHRLHNDFVDGFEYMDEMGDLCFLLLMIKQHSDIQQKQVAFSHHKLSPTTIGSGGHDNVIIEEGTAFAWLKQRAYDELRLSNEQRGQLTSRFLDGSGLHIAKAVTFSRDYTKTLQDGEATNIIRQSKWNSWNNGWRYHSVNRAENGFLIKIPEILQYSRTCGYGEWFLEHLSNKIKCLKNPTQFTYLINFGEVPCTFTIVVMVNEIRVKRAYIDAIRDGKQYLQGLGRALNLTSADGWDMFQQTLCFNIEFSGISATEFKQLEFKVGGKNGTATYLLVATNVDYSYKVTVCYAYHHIDQHILDHEGFTMQTADMTLDWMRAKSCQSLATMLPPSLAPQLIYE
ncbi:unnamed protein product [Rotaria sp. Silwood1]|nr:unnamed protein product [Rotaria sp. Silwood1]